MNRSLVLAAAGVLLLGPAGCGEDADPPAADARICGATMASWWYDATGAGTLTGMLDGQKLPLTNPSQSDATFAHSTSTVFSEGKSIAGFKAELTTGDEVLNTAASIKTYPAEGQFTAAGGAGAIEPTSPDVTDITRAWWTCKSTVLSVEVSKPKDQDSREELVKDLARKIAEVTGCPGPVPKAS
jgi:hypothetical protein